MLLSDTIRAPQVRHIIKAAWSSFTDKEQSTESCFLFVSQKLASPLLFLIPILMTVLFNFLWECLSFQWLGADSPQVVWSEHYITGKRYFLLFLKVNIWTQNKKLFDSSINNDFICVTRTARAWMKPPFKLASKTILKNINQKISFWLLIGTFICLHRKNAEAPLIWTECTA